ncbi:MAG: transcriptional regulator [Parvularculaceae bacterium]|nr:transcriptional regulator [Parvularculaceae bacterium]
MTDGPDDSAAFQIGDWTYDPKSDELVRGGETRPLEFRAARLLEILCRRRGAVVPREDILAAVWQGRSLSEHTIAVVISNLRKALDDDARSPRFIETVSKRGYRLLAQESAAPAPTQPPVGARPNRRAIGLGVFGLAAAALLSGFFVMRDAASDAPRTIITINTIENASGADINDALAATVGEFAADHLSRAGDSVLIRDFNDGDSWKTSKALERLFGRETVIYHLNGKIVADAGAPFVVLTVADGRDWSIIWTSTIAVDADGVAPALQASLNDFLASVGRLKKKSKKIA